MKKKKGLCRGGVQAMENRAEGGESKNSDGGREEEM